MVYNSSTQLGAATVSGTNWGYSATVANGTTYQFNVRETDLVGNVSSATTNFVVTGDTTEPTVSLVTTTADNQSLISISDNITVTFSEAMVFNYVTTSTSDTYCRGSIMVSSASDNFSSGTDSCVRMSSEPVSSNSNRTWTLDPVDNLTAGTTYLTRVTTGVIDAAGNAMSSQYDNSTGFTTVTASSSSSLGIFVAVGASGNIVRSTDNVSTWDNATSPTGNLLKRVVFGNNTFVAVGDSGNIVRSTDSGSSWDNVTSPTGSHLRGVGFGNNTFVVVGRDGTIVRSTDNGTTWDNVSYTGYSTGRHFYGVTFGNNTFVAVGEGGNMVRSTDNGSSFDNVTNSNGNTLQQVTFGNNTFVAVGYGGIYGTILYKGIVRSTDNGSSWDNATSPNTTVLDGVTFGNNTFLAVAREGNIVRSTDNGSSFDNVTGIIGPNSSVTFGNDTFVGVSYNGDIMRSTDNGSSWDNLTSPTTNALYRVTFSE